MFVTSLNLPHVDVLIAAFKSTGVLPNSMSLQITTCGCWMQVELEHNCNGMGLSDPGRELQAIRFRSRMEAVQVRQPLHPRPTLTCSPCQAHVASPLAYAPTPLYSSCPTSAYGCLCTYFKISADAQNVAACLFLLDHCCQLSMVYVVVTGSHSVPDKGRLCNSCWNYEGCMA